VGVRDEAELGPAHLYDIARDAEPSAFSPQGPARRAILASIVDVTGTWYVPVGASLINPQQLTTPPKSRMQPPPPGYTASTGSPKAIRAGTRVRRPRWGAPPSVSPQHHASRDGVIPQVA
jgi:hypothetical protein